MSRGRKIVKQIEYEECSMMTAAEDTQKIYRNYVGCFVEWCGKDTIVSNITAKTFEDYICIKSKVAIPKYERVLKEPYTDDEMKLLLARPKTDNCVEWKCWCMINYFFGTGQSRRIICSQNMKLTN